jgi:hypothetical protein
MPTGEFFDPALSARATPLKQRHTAAKTNENNILDPVLLLRSVMASPFPS